MTILVTGGAGFIGSHLVDHFMERGEKVCVLDDLSAGSLSNLEGWIGTQGLKFIEGDLLKRTSIEASLEGCDVVYHLAANPEVRSWKARPEDHFRYNVEATFNLLEAVREQGDVETLVFTSTSTVYGEANVLPTPETYAPLKPISNYGASKLAAEALICSYASMYGFRCVIYRMANVVGPRSNHGVVYDFVEKLSRNPRELEVLGDGSQSKSYLFVNDCVDGMVFGVEGTDEQVEILNIGSEDRVDVLTIARIVVEEMGLEDVEIRLTGGVDGGRGWKGDVKLMQLDVSRLKSLGWRPNWGSAEAVRLTARSLIEREKG
jgi:UDP-glucose 4-epimerase